MAKTKINTDQYDTNGGWVELARYTGSVGTTPIAEVPFESHKYIRIVIQSVQSSTQTSETVLGLRFNGKSAVSDYARQQVRFSSTALAGVSTGDTERIIMGVSNFQNSQALAELEITGTTWAGWNRGSWGLTSDYNSWANCFGQANLKSTNNLTSFSLYATAGTYNVEAIVYGHN